MPELNEAGERVSWDKRNVDNYLLRAIYHRIQLHYWHEVMVNIEKADQEKLQIPEIFEIKTRKHNSHIKTENIIGCINKRTLRNRL